MSDQEIADRTGQAPAAPAGGLAAPPGGLPNEPYYQRSAPRRGARNASLGVALVLVGLVLLAFQVFGRGLSFGGTIPLVDQRVAGSRLELAVGSSDVEVRAWNGPDIRVEATQRGGSRGDYSVDVSTAGSTVRVTEASHSWLCIFCSQQLSYRISLPSGVQANIRTASGDIDAADLSGAAALASASGEIHASDLTGGLSAGTSSGEVRLNDLRGKLDVTTISGDIRLESGQLDDATISTTSGSVELDSVAGPLKISSISGDVTVQDAQRSQLEISTTSGDVEYSGDLAPGGTNSINSVSGEVKLQLQASNGIRLDANTISGQISSDFDLAERAEGLRSLNGVVGDGSAALKIETTSGDISLEKR